MVIVMNRKLLDQIVSGSAAVVAVVLVVLGGLVIYGGTLGRQNVRDRLAATLPSLQLTQ
jgi:hypothetical protein